MSLILPNTITNGENADATEVQGNFNAITNFLNGNLITADGATEMAAPLVLVGDPTADRHAANKGYVDARDAAVTSVKVSKAGDTMTGDLTMASGQHVFDGVNPTSASQLTRKAYVDTQDALRVAVVGDTMTGDLSMASGKHVFDGVNPTSASHLTRKAYVDTTFVALAGDTMTGDLVMGANQVTSTANPVSANDLTRKGYTDAAFVAKAGDVMTGDLRLGGIPNSGTPTAGVLLDHDGEVRVVVPGAALTTTANLMLGRGTGAAGAVTSRFAKFERGGIEIGSIAIDSATTVGFNTTSDERTKHRDGDITDAAERVQRLGALAFRGQILDDDGNPDGTVRDLIYAHDVAVEAPYAVQGERGGSGFQTVNFTGLIPLLLAALGDALDRIAVLEGV